MVILGQAMLVHGHAMTMPWERHGQLWSLMAIPRATVAMPLSPMGMPSSTVATRVHPWPYHEQP